MAAVNQSFLISLSGSANARVVKCSVGQSVLGVGLIVKVVEEHYFIKELAF